MKEQAKPKLMLEKKVIAVLDRNKLQNIVAGDKGHQALDPDLDMLITLSWPLPFCRLFQDEQK